MSVRLGLVGSLVGSLLKSNAGAEHFEVPLATFLDEMVLFLDHVRHTGVQNLLSILMDHISPPDETRYISLFHFSSIIFFI
jgi:hypothetical protein